MSVYALSHSYDSDSAYYGESISDIFSSPEAATRFIEALHKEGKTSEYHKPSDRKYGLTKWAEKNIHGICTLKAREYEIINNKKEYYATYTLTKYDVIN